MRVCVVLLLAAFMAIAGCAGHVKNNLPPAEMLMHPGPGVDGPGPGVMMYPPTAPGCGAQAPVSQIAFVGPEGTTITWDVGGQNQFDSQPLVAPGRYNFPQGAIYRLKMTNVPGRPGVELYPTLEVAPVRPRTEAYLAHNAIPVQFSEEDFDQVLTGNFVTKVIYLPDPEFQELALAGVETLVSTRLDPGVDPIVEADRRGSILGIVRLGNKDLEVPGGVVQDGAVHPTSYVMGANGQPVAGPGVCPTGMPTGGAMMPNQYVAGSTMPQYGMPYCGTPIGLPGPPHIPLGVPAGLQQHVIKNHTCVNVPGPTEKIKIDVRQDPGFSYPKPASHAYIVEQTLPGKGLFSAPCQKQVISNGACETSCPASAETSCPAGTASSEE